MLARFFVARPVFATVLSAVIIIVGLVALVEAIMDNRRANPPADKGDRDMLDVLVDAGVADGTELAVPGRDSGLGDSLDVLLVLAAPLDQVGDRDIRCGELLPVAIVAWQPAYRRIVGLFGHDVAPGLGDRRKWILGDLAAGEDRRLLVKQANEQADDARLRLARAAQYPAYYGNDGDAYRYRGKDRHDR